MRRLPWALVIFRLVAAPALLGLALIGPSAAITAAALLSLAVLSDILDGVIARRLDCVTPNLRHWDSRADVVFWLGAAIALLLMHPALVATLLPPALALVALETANHALSIAKFRREASPHHWMSKVFCLALWALFAQLFVTGQPTALLWAAFGLGVISQIEAAAITLRLKTWRCDVPSVFSLNSR
ncbi:CDP-alcohol phosphatidyltransferase family protein [Brevundimonas aurantiaca]|uniref:CDP-alcohol phosphatidyltransferase family protein n=1 Tax=Brevundimonas aurantiaca TaxID=74316 RepID=UPI00174A5674|nr:CDP-alcohol phosphatidyltransferase family protein [Brevundimonas aurantiaca]